MRKHTHWSWRRVLTMALVVVLSVLILSDAASACPTCRQGLTDGDEASQRLITGYFWSIMFMMSMPFAILAGVGGLMYREVRKARAKANAETAQSTPEVESFAGRE